MDNELYKRLRESDDAPERAITRDEFIGKKSGGTTSEVPPPSWVKDIPIWDAAVASLKDAGTLLKDGKPNYGAIVAVYKNKKAKKGEDVKEYSGSYGAA